MQKLKYLGVSMTNRGVNGGVKAEVLWLNAA